MKITCIVPIKYESTRVPGKNYRDFNGKPLLYWVINILLSIENINKVIIDTDNEKIENIIKNYFNSNKLIIYYRPEHLQGGNISTNKLLKNIITDLNLEEEIFLQTHVTNPLIKKETIENTINFFINNINKYDSLFTVKTLHTRLYNKDFTEINHNRFNLIPTQDLDEIYEENSCIYLFKKNTLFKYKSRIGTNPYLFKMSDIESTDIDWEEDFIIAKTLHKLYN